MGTAQRGSTDQALLVFDGDCAFCTSSVRWLAEHLPVAPAMTPYQFADLGALGLTAAECAERIWLVTPSRQYGGYLALAKLLQHQPRGWVRFFGHLADTLPFSLGSAGVYALVARNRHRLPGGTPACALPSPARSATAPARSATAPARSATAPAVE